MAVSMIPERPEELAYPAAGCIGLHVIACHLLCLCSLFRAVEAMA